MKILGRQHRNGMAMTIVIIIVIILVSLVGFVTSLGFNQRKFLGASSGKKLVLYYRAQAGAVEAAWRIRENYTTGLSPAGSFGDPAYNPAVYLIDVDGDGTMDTNVDIDVVGANGSRKIISTAQEA